MNKKRYILGQYCGKVRYFSEREAKHKLRQARGKIGVVSCYLCPLHGDEQVWHLTSSRQT